ncbi:MAG: hypothetical protein ACRENJ_06690, partial [Candidatus Eiseniibacteriota bacterium]
TGSGHGDDAGAGTGTAPGDGGTPTASTGGTEGANATNATSEDGGKVTTEAGSGTGGSQKGSQGAGGNGTAPTGGGTTPRGRPDLSGAGGGQAGRDDPWGSAMGLSGFGPPSESETGDPRGSLLGTATGAAGGVPGIGPGGAPGGVLGGTGTAKLDEPPLTGTGTAITSPTGHPSGVGTDNGGTTNPLTLRGESDSPAPAGYPFKATDPNGAPDGSVTGTADGAPEGREKGKPGGREPGVEHGTGTEVGTERGGKNTALDHIMKYAGYLNFEFSEPKHGESGGVPGGMGVKGHWLGQILYLIGTILSLGLIGALLKAVRLGLQGAIRGAVQLLRSPRVAGRAALATVARVAPIVARKVGHVALTAVRTVLGFAYATVRTVANMGLTAVRTIAGAGRLLGRGVSHVLERLTKRRLYVDVYRFTDYRLPGMGLLPRLSTADRITQRQIARMMRDPDFVQARANMHMAYGMTENSPFVSLLWNPVNGARTTDGWLRRIATGADQPWMRAPHIAQFRVPFDRLFLPGGGNLLSIKEGEVLWRGNDLAKYLVGWLRNPF